MTKEVLLSIKGLQFHSDEDTDKIETITSAKYYNKKGYHYLFFEETTEGFRETTKNMYKFNEKELIINKRGMVKATMIFEEGEKNITNYKTPFGNILIGINTSEIAVEEEEDLIKLRIHYSLEVNYEHLANCNIYIKISNKEKSGKFL